MEVPVLNSRGFSMVFVLAAMVLTGFIGASMIKLATSDQLGNANYAVSGTARSAAQSGILAATQKLEVANPQAAILPKL